jgi:tRNA(fMet)-specific endonuclease VapC
MEITIDSDVIIAGEKGVFDLQAWLRSRTADTFAISAISVAEVRHGIERASVAHKSHRERYLDTLLDGLTIYPYTRRTATEHARIWAELESSGRMIGYYDLILAATALERHTAIATFNKKHFSQIRSIVLVDPVESKL